MKSVNNANDYPFGKLCVLHLNDKHSFPMYVFVSVGIQIKIIRSVNITYSNRTRRVLFRIVYVRLNLKIPEKLRFNGSGSVETKRVIGSIKILVK